MKGEGAERGRDQVLQQGSELGRVVEGCEAPLECGVPDGAIDEVEPSCWLVTDRVETYRWARTGTPGRSEKAVASAVTTLRSEALAVAAMIRS